MKTDVIQPFSVFQCQITFTIVTYKKYNPLVPNGVFKLGRG